MLNKKDYEMGSKSNDDFTVAMKKVIESEHFLDFADSTAINEEMFVKFWTFFNKLFMKLDRNNDQRVSVIEAQKYLTERANEKGLKKDHIIYQEVVNFMRQGGDDHDGNVTIIEFFINLPNFEAFFVNFDVNDETA